MYIITKEPKQLINLDNQSIKIEDYALVTYPERRTLATGHEGEQRFYDIVEAIRAGAQFYDCSQEVGKAWKPEKKKPGPKPKAKEEHKPEPKTE